VPHRINQNTAGIERAIYRSLSPQLTESLPSRTIVDDLRSQGFTSVRAISTQLNERGILTPRGGAWHPTSAARLLSRLQS